MNIEQTDPGLSSFVVDDSNFQSLARQVQDPSSPFNGGFDASQVQSGFAAPYTRSIIPRKDWPDLIKYHEDRKSSPDHWRLRGGVPITDQNGFGYCWGYGTSGAINTAYAQTGLTGLRLNPFYTAWMVKNGRNQGGWAGEYIEGVDKWGIAEESVWAPDDHTGRLANSHEVQLNAKLHGLVEYEELERESFDSLASCVLDPERPCPATVGLAWMGHLMYVTKILMLGPDKFAGKVVNSWKITWGQQGCAAFAESKLQAFEQIAIVRVKPRVAV